ncbi:MAG: post-transcriptional regulator [Erysipelotrichaceae bacterium]
MLRYERIDKMNTLDLKENSQIKLAISLKTNQLKREQLSSLTYQFVENTLFGYKWKRCEKLSLHQAIDDIFNLTIGEVVAYLSNQAIIMGSQMEFNDFNDLLGGN